MGRPKSRTMSEKEWKSCASATSDVREAEARLAAATARRHALWRSLVVDGHAQTEIAEASGVLRQAIGWVLRDVE